MAGVNQGWPRRATRAWVRGLRLQTSRQQQLAVVWFPMQRNDGEVVVRDSKGVFLATGAGLLLLVATLMGSF